MKKAKIATWKSLYKCLEFIKSCSQISSSGPAELAYEISVENKTTFYDSLFLAAAENEKVPLRTPMGLVYIGQKVVRERESRKRCSYGLGVRPHRMASN